jgi:hypothetical protein
VSRNKNKTMEEKLNLQNTFMQVNTHEIKHTSNSLFKKANKKKS